jgi:acetylornithine deacetylase
MSSLAPKDAALLADIAAAVDANRDKQVAWLQKLVRFPSTRGNEADCQNWLAAEFGARNWKLDRYALSDVPIEGKQGYSPAFEVDYARAIQLVATLQAPDPTGRSLILQGHIDVVPAGPAEHWARPPFEPHLADGFLHGRGSSDMKVGVAAIVFALDALAGLGLEPAAPIFVQTVSEEECTGNGALSTLVRGYRADACLIPEASGNRLLRAQLGSVWFRVRILGRPGHVLQAQANASAILLAYDYMAALQTLTDEINARAKTHPWFGHIDKPVKFSVGKIRGGDWLGSIPGWCEIDCRLSVLPGDALADMRHWVCEAVAACATRLGAFVAPEVSWIGFQADGHVFAPGTAAEEVLGCVHKAVFGEELTSFSQTATSDSRQYDLYYGIPALCYGPKGSGAHSAEEKTDLASMIETTKVIALFIARWCGVRIKKDVLF